METTKTTKEYYHMHTYIQYVQVKLISIGHANVCAYPGTSQGERTIWLISVEACQRRSKFPTQKG